MWIARVTNCLCFKIISHHAPIYLSELLHLYTPSWQLRSSTDTRVFRIPSFRTKSCGQRSFSYQAPVIWNQLPVSVRHSTSVSSFKYSVIENLSLFKNLFFSFIALIFDWCVCVCVFVRVRRACVRVRVCVCACVCVCIQVICIEF